MQFSFVLVRPQFSGNLGAIARAMKNMGFADLRLVEPEVTAKDAEARKMAVHATDVLDQTRTFWDLKDALTGLDLVAGTSRRVGKDRMGAMTPREFAEFCLSLPRDSRIAVLFGTEDTGLTGEELKYCQRVVSIPSHPGFPSLNLAQAVMIVCYELYLALQSEGRPPLGAGKTAMAKIAVSAEGTLAKAAASAEAALAKAENLEAMYGDLEDLLSQSGFLDKNNPEHLMQLLRNLFSRALPTEKEVKILRGICRQLRWWADQ
jgi:tRNA/rRNA methyltransferase